MQDQPGNTGVHELDAAVHGSGVVGRGLDAIGAAGEPGFELPIAARVAASRRPSSQWIASLIHSSELTPM